jgi:hypothetical protein
MLKFIKMAVLMDFRAVSGKVNVLGICIKEKWLQKVGLNHFQNGRYHKLFPHNPVLFSCHSQNSFYINFRK